MPLDPFVLSNRQLNVFIYVVVDTFTNRDPRDRILKKHSTERKLKNRGWVKKKTSMGVRAAFAVFLLFIATVEAEDGKYCIFILFDLILLKVPVHWLSLIRT